MEEGLLRVNRSLAKLLVSRAVAVIGVALFVSFVTFFILRLSRDPVDTVGLARGVNLSVPAERAALAADLGTDRSLIAQYGDWLGGAVRGDLGASLYRPDQQVAATIGRALPVNIQLVVLAQMMALAVGIPLGLWSGANAGRRVDRAVSGFATAFVSYPGFALALLLITVFAVELGWFPVTAAAYVGFFDDPLANLRQTFLPALSLAIPMIGVYTRVLRADVATTVQEDFIMLARAKGLRTGRILFRHALRPSSLSLIPLVGLQCGALLGGSILVERLFAYPYGLGSSLVTAAVGIDVPVLLGVTTTIAVVFAVVTIAADMLARLVDPRIGNG